MVVRSHVLKSSWLRFCEIISSLVFGHRCLSESGGSFTRWKICACLHAVLDDVSWLDQTLVEEDEGRLAIYAYPC